MSGDGNKPPVMRLASRYYEALADALEALRAFGHEADAKEIEDRYSLVYVEPSPEVRLSLSAPPDEGDPLDGLAGDEIADAEIEFLLASIAVWEEIDKHIDGEGHYRGGVPEALQPSNELRRRELEAWRRYRDLRSARRGDQAAPPKDSDSPAGTGTGKTDK